jgi:hypothetical protein
LTCFLIAALLMRLGPGSTMEEHVDPDVDARLDGRRVLMQAGSAC